MTTTTRELDELLGGEWSSALGEPTVAARGLPARVYFEPAIFDLECERLFPRTWMAAGVASDIPEPGDVLLVTIGRRNIILLRDQDREIRGFFNSCRHRGMKLLCGEQRRVHAITCPFHGWTYGLDGRLRGTPYLGGVGKNTLEGFDRENLGLIPVAVGQWCNTLFVNLDRQAPPLADHLAPLVKHLGGARDWAALYHHKPGSIQANQVGGNWKEYIEVALEELHLKSAHPQVFEGVDPLSWQDTPVVDGHLWGSEALISGSYGAGHKYFSGIPLPQWIDRGDSWQSYVSLFPNLGIFVTSDQLSIEFVLPTDADHYQHRQEFYFAGDVEPQTTHREAIEALLSAWDLLNTQDAALLEGLHDTQRTNQYVDNRSRFAGDWEVNVHRFQQYYANALRT